MLHHAVEVGHCQRRHAQIEDSAEIESLMLWLPFQLVPSAPASFCCKRLPSCHCEQDDKFCAGTVLHDEYLSLALTFCICCHPGAILHHVHALFGAHVLAAQADVPLCTCLMAASLLWEVRRSRDQRWTGTHSQHELPELRGLQGVSAPMKKRDSC